MIFFILTLIITIIVGIKTYYPEHRGGNVFISLSFGIAISLVMSLIFGFFYSDIGYDSVQTELLSVKDSVSSYGRFALGSGTIQGEMYYFGYIRENNGFKVFKIKGGDDLLIVENGESSAVYEEYNPKVKMKLWGLAVGETPKDRVLYVPKDTIYLNQYELDLK